MRVVPAFGSLLAALLVLASGLAAQSADAHLPGLIAFDRAIDGGGRVLVVGTDGRDARSITPVAGFEAPAWSPDGSTLVYESGGGLANSELYAYGMSNGAVRRLTRHRGLDAFPAWSPDGSRIAWTTNRSGAFEIWVMRHDGTGARMLTRGPADSHPAWSPAGGTIAFVRAPTGSLELVRADGTRARRIGRGRAFDVSTAPAWSPDGRWLAISGVDGALYAVAADGHAIRRLTPGRPATIAWRPSWSPRGGRVAFINLADGSLEVAEIGPGRVHRLARQTDELSTPAWSPDGRMLVFADHGKHLEVLSSDGHAARVLTHGIWADADPAWRP